MAKEIINIGITANDNQGDTIRASFTKCNNNFTELYDAPVLFAPIADPTFTGEIGIGAVNVSETELGILEGATLDTTELNYVDGVVSNIQTQLNIKAPLASPAFTTAIGTDFLTASEIIISDASKNIISAPVATYPSLTELTYVKDVTGAIQTQMDLKAPKLNPPTTVAAATYDLLVTDYILNVTYTGTGAVTSLTLPTAQVVSGREFTVVDGGGNASVNNITIDTEGAETIIGNATYVINTDYNSVTLYSDGINWFVK